MASTVLNGNDRLERNICFAYQSSIHRNELHVVVLHFQDSCYDDNNDPVGETKVDEAIRLCVTVIDFAPESKRAAQMLVCDLCMLISHKIRE
jgi:hypothetical protein